MDVETQADRQGEGCQPYRRGPAGPGEWSVWRSDCWSQDSSSRRCSSRSTVCCSGPGRSDVSPRTRRPAGPSADREPFGHAAVDGCLVGQIRL